MSDRKLTTLFLDIGGVLLSNGWGHDFRQKAINHFHLDQEEIEERHSIMFVTYEEGGITLDEYLHRVIFYKKRDFTFNEFRDFMFSLTTPDKEMIPFIKAIKQKYGLKIVAVSNEARELNAYRIKSFELNRLIDYFVSSCYVHIRKPNTRLFELALDIAQVPENEVIYIDDVQIFTEVATGLGIKSICHSSYLSTRNALATLGLPVKQENIEYA